MTQSDLVAPLFEEDVNTNTYGLVDSTSGLVSVISANAFWLRGSAYWFLPICIKYLTAVN